MASLWKLGNLGWRELAKRVWKEIQDDEVFGRAAELSYYFLLALFPFLIFLTSVIGLVLGSETALVRRSLTISRRVMPPSAYQLISPHDDRDFCRKQWRKNLVWTSRCFVGGVEWDECDHYFTQCRVRSEGESSRGGSRRLTAIGLTIALSVLIISALLLVVAGGWIADWLASTYGLGPTFPLPGRSFSGRWFLVA